MFSGTKSYRTKPPVGVMLNPLHPLSQGLVGCWLFNEGGGSVAHDISGHRNHGTLKNMSPNEQDSGWSGSKFGGGLNFDGSDDYVKYENDPSFQSNTGTWEIWAKQPSIADNKFLISYYVNSSNRVKIFTYDNTSDIVFAFNLKKADLWTIKHYESSIPIVADTWYHIVVTQDASNMKFYINGIDQGVAGVNSGDWLNDLGTGTITMGAGDAGAGITSFYNVLVASAQNYNRALLPAEIKQLYEDPFGHLLRVPVRYAPAAPGGLSIPVAMNYYRRRRIA